MSLSTERISNDELGGCLLSSAAAILHVISYVEKTHVGNNYSPVQIITDDEFSFQQT